MWRDVYTILMILFLVIAFLGITFFLTNPPARLRTDSAKNDLAREIRIQKETKYTQAITCIEEEKYGEAAELLRYQLDYKHGKALYHYASAKEFYMRQDHLSYIAYSSLDEIPSEYQGPFADEIRAFRKEIQPHQEEMIQLFYDEIDRQIAEARASGKWDNADSYQQPSYSSGSRKKSSSTRSFSDNDPLNAKDYAHADDFYYDHWNDFVDFEDAENYYDEHN